MTSDLTKNERIRRLRLRDMRNYLRGRYGHTLPDDDAGREYLRELLYPISVGPNAAIKMPKAIEIWAPWMNAAEVGELIPVHQSKRQVSKAVHATSRPKLNINRKSRRNRTAESIAADATNRSRVLRTPPVHSTVGIGHHAGPPLNSPVDLPEMVDDLSIPAFLRRHPLPEAAE